MVRSGFGGIISEVCERAEGGSGAAPSLQNLLCLCHIHCGKGGTKNGVGAVGIGPVRIFLAFARGYCAFPAAPFQSGGTHLVVVTRNSQGCCRVGDSFLFFWSWLSGRSCQIICLDTGSSDDTLAILQRLKHRYPWIRIRSVMEHQLADRMAEEGADGDRVVVMDLRNRQYGWGIPLDLHG